MKTNLLAKVGLSLVLCLLLGRTQMSVVRHPADKVETQDQVWTNYTNGNYVNDLAFEGNYLWAATEGGVVRWDVRDGSYRKYTRSDGLAER